MIPLAMLAATLAAIALLARRRWLAAALPAAALAALLTLTPQGNDTIQSLTTFVTAVSR